MLNTANSRKPEPNPIRVPAGILLIRKPMPIPTKSPAGIRAPSAFILFSCAIKYKMISCF